MATFEASHPWTWRLWKGKSEVLVQKQTTLLEAISAFTNKTILSTFKSQEIKSPRSTIGVQTYEIKKLNELNSIDITIWDFAGQLEYLVNHQVI